MILRSISTLCSIILFSTLISCNGRVKSKKSVEGSVDRVTESVTLKHATEFKIDRSEDETILSIHRKGNSDIYDSFKLVSGDSEVDDLLTTIKVPCRKIVCLSSTQLTYFFSLDNIDNIVAVNSSRYLRHEGMKAKLESGEVKSIGKEGNFNLEMVAALDPDVIFVSPFKSGGFDVLRNMGIPLVPMAAYNEGTPLGRAEWIKMIALFTGQEALADSLFDGVETRYTDLKELTKDIEDRPTVLSGKLRSGSWYLPGGKSFYAHYFRDAGAEYIIDDDKTGAYPVDFETIYSKASECDYWCITHPETTGFTLDDLEQQDERYSDFSAFSNKRVMLCNIRETPYYEQVGMKPDVLLADYIYNFHRELLPDYKPYFYQRLE